MRIAKELGVRVRVGRKPSYYFPLSSIRPRPVSPGQPGGMEKTQPQP